MADSKISELTAITGANTADDDLLVIVDTSASQTKKITLGELENALAERDFNFGDNDKAIFGAGSDLQIYHSGSASYISENSSSGALLIQGEELILENPDGTNYFRAATDGSVKLYNSGAVKLSTTSTGIDVTGTVTADGLTVDGGVEISAATATLKMFETDSTDLNTYLRTGNGEFRINTADDAGAGTAERFTIDHSTGDISFYEDTGTTAKFFWDASAESLGIGTSSPATNLSVSSSGAGAKIFVARQVTSGNLSNTAAGGSIEFGSADSSTYAEYTGAAIKLIADQAWTAGSAQGSALAFNVTADGTATLSEAMRIDSSGNLLVGKTSSNSNIEGAELRANGGVFGCKDDGSVAVFNRKTSDGDIAVFRKDGTTVGSIGTNGNLYIQGPSGTSGAEFANNAVRPWKDGARVDATVDLGVSAGRFKDLYLSGGVYLGGTGAANKLDDYEEGTWTPTQGTFLTWSSPVFTAKYTKIGNLVTISLRQTSGTVGWSAGQAMGGVPFNVDSGDIAYASDTGPSSDNGLILVWTNELIYFNKANLSETALMFTATFRTTA